MPDSEEKAEGHGYRQGVRYVCVTNAGMRLNGRVSVVSHGRVSHTAGCQVCHSDIPEPFVAVGNHAGCQVWHSDIPEPFVAVGVGEWLKSKPWFEACQADM